MIQRHQSSSSSSIKKKTEFSDALSKLFKKSNTSLDVLATSKSKPPKPDKPHKPPKPNPSKPPKPPKPTPDTPNPSPSDPPGPTMSNLYIIDDNDLSVMNDIAPSVIASARRVERNSPLFPLARFDGKMCQGGNGGVVLTVNRLDDSSNTRGTFRWALQQTGPRIIKFSVQGIINLKQNLIVREGRVTIDSGDDKVVVIAGAGVTFQGVHDVYIKNMRFRPGSALSLSEHKTYDALTIMESVYVYLDHVSASWSTDECLSVNKSAFVTVDHCLIAGPLADPQLHIENGEPIAHDYGSLITGHRITVSESLWAFYNIRGPQTDIDSGSTKVFVKCVGYCFTGSGARIRIHEDSVGCVGFVDMVYRQPDSPSDMNRKPDLEFINVPSDASSIRPKQIIWVPPKRDIRPDPYVAPVFSGTNSNANTERINAIKETRMNPLRDNIPIEIRDIVQSGGQTSAQDIYESVLQNVGSLVPQRDPVDEWFIKQIRDKKYIKLQKESDMGGYALYPFWLRRPL